MTEKQNIIVDEFYSRLTSDQKGLFSELIDYLIETGYRPHKVRANTVFKHESHNKQMAKIGFGKTSAPFFALRFSACGGYSERFAAVVRDAIEKFPSKNARCFDRLCDFCNGAPETHSYAFTFPDGTTRNHCGAYALEIPSITAADLDEIKALIKEEHEYLMKNEAMRALSTG
jgi:hypothetical protein